jgi:hypothetical protein
MMSFQSFSSCAVSIHSERGTCWDTWSWRASWSYLIMVLCRVDCGLPLFCGLLTQVARGWHGSLFIGILASLPIQQRDLLMRKMRISGTLAHFRVWALVILYFLTLNMLMFSMVLRLWWWNTWRVCLMESVMVHASQPQRAVLSAVAIYTVVLFRGWCRVPEEGS